MRLPRRLLYGILILVVAVPGFMIWASAALGPSPEALAALQPDAQVAVSTDEMIVFQPVGKTPSTALVFYPGGRVDYRSYAAPLRRIAAQGYLVILLPVRLNLALLDVGAADRALAAFPEVQRWIVGGHSLGGVAAASYASGHDGIEGLVLWASRPANDSLRNSDVAVLSIYGTQDRSAGDLQEANVLLPSDARVVVVEGGNHAQFGDYGPQPGDNEATISRLEQQKQAVDATVTFLREISQ